MIAASLKNAEGDPIIDLLLKKGADVNAKSNSGQVCLISINQVFVSSLTVIPSPECSPLRNLQSQPFHRSYLNSQ